MYIHKHPSMGCTGGANEKRFGFYGPAAPQPRIPEASQPRNPAASQPRSRAAPQPRSPIARQSGSPALEYVSIIK